MKTSTMSYSLQILLYIFVCASAVSYAAKTSTKSAELSKKLPKDVESIPASTIIGEVQGVQVNRSSVNLEQLDPKNPEPSNSAKDNKPGVQFDNQYHPYHYQTSYHYQYPPPPNELQRPLYEDFYRPYFRPKDHLVDPRYYKPEPYGPLEGPPIPPNVNAEVDKGAQKVKSETETGTVPETKHASVPERRDLDYRRPYDPRSGPIYNSPEPLPPNAFAHRDILRPSQVPSAFPSVDFDRFRDSVLSRPLVDRYYFGTGREPYPGRDDPKLTDSRQSGSLEFNEYPAAPGPFQNYPNDAFQGGFQGLDQRSQHLPGPFLGSFLYPGNRPPFSDNYQPSNQFNNLFNDNFTSGFPPRPPFNGFYPRSYYPPPSQPVLPASPAQSADPALGPGPAPPVPEKLREPEPIPSPGASSSDQKSVVSPDVPVSGSTSAASSISYQVRFFKPASRNREDVFRHDDFDYFDF